MASVVVAVRAVLGEMTGTTWLEESGFLEGPVLITNTYSIGAVHDPGTGVEFTAAP